MEITDLDKNVYNLYLSSVRRAQGKPHTLRKNFDGFEDDDMFPYLKVLSALMAKNPNLFCKEFFEAPYKLSTREKKYFDLKFYASFQAIGAYTQYIKSLENRPPSEQLGHIASSFKHIFTFCKNKQIHLDEYAFYKTIAQYDFLAHIKDHQVSPYVIFCMPKMYTIMTNLDPDIFHLFFGDLNLVALQKDYENSEKVSKFCISCKEKISKKLLTFEY